MSSLLNSTINTRAILPNSLRYIRSDVPYKITESEIQWLIDNNITTVIDLREENERLQKKCHLIDNIAFNYVCMSVTGGNAIPPTTDDVSKSYIRMADSNMDKIIEEILSAETNVIYFCNAGKDRTGVVSAILLHKLGCSREYIVDDYMQSADNLKEMLEAFCEQHPDVKEIITPQKRYMNEFLDWLYNNS
ncbi:MAG: tyrosine-protein phosphatase [Oscillospiraceae bacterium]|nr:tyrosine-protein phosphatase [Oscillospiraceae bacterium]